MFLEDNYCSPYYHHGGKGIYDVSSPRVLCVPGVGASGGAIERESRAASAGHVLAFVTLRPGE